MSTFARTFSIELISDQVLEENPWFEDLLRLWSPAGDAPHTDKTEEHQPASSGSTPEEDPLHLRLAIRNGSLNFYRAGQSIAEVQAGPKIGLRASIHNKYVLGDEGQGQSSVTLSSAGLSDQDGGCRKYRGLDDDLRHWIANINEKHIGEEKRFVDLVAARNPDTIDLEMALPAYSLVPEERIAPRMDLVALERVGRVGDCWRIVFWEVKLVDDARARCRGDDVSPKVVKQLAQYTSWLRHADHRDLVAREYQNTCRLLVEFRELAERLDLGIKKLGPGIVAAAAAGAKPLLVDDEPRLLIDDDRTRDGRTRNLAFAKNGHLDKLRNKGLHVQMVHSLNQMRLEARP